MAEQRVDRVKTVAKAVTLVFVIGFGGMYGVGYYFGLDFKSSEKCKALSGNPMAAMMGAAMVNVAMEAHMANSTDPYPMKLGASHGLKKAILQCLFVK